MRILVSEAILRDYGDELRAAAPDATFVRLLPDGTVTDDGPLDVVFISNDIFYGPIKACMQIVLDTPQLAWLQSAAAGVEAPAFRTHLERGGRLTRAHVTAVPISEYVMQAVLASFQQPQRLAEQRTGARLATRARFAKCGARRGSSSGSAPSGVRSRNERARSMRMSSAYAGGPTAPNPSTRSSRPIACSTRCSRADVVVIAAELNDGNRHLVDANFLAAMRPGLVLRQRRARWVGRRGRAARRPRT